MIEQTISIERIEDVIDIFGSFDENIKLIEHELDVSVVSRDDQLKISGEAENVLYAVKAVQGLLGLAGRKETITEQNVRYIINLVKAGNEEHINDIARDVLCVTAKGKPIKPKTLGQKRYVDAIKKNTITLGIGPAGTGKTYLAVAAARGALPGQASSSASPLPLVPPPRGRLPGQAGQPHHPHPPGGGGRGAAGLPARRSAEQGGPLSAAPVRRPLRHAGGGDL